jgi:hypothetical protein
VQGCQWIQKRRSLGLLTSIFLPNAATEQLRTYCRHRTLVLRSAAITTQKMLKYLRLPKLRVDVVVKDVTVVTSMSIIEAISRMALKSLPLPNVSLLAPNTKISGGKELSSKIPKGSNRLKIALRQNDFFESEAPQKTAQYLPLPSFELPL